MPRFIFFVLILIVSNKLRYDNDVCSDRPDDIFMRLEPDSSSGEMRLSNCYRGDANDATDAVRDLEDVYSDTDKKFQLVFFFPV